MNKPDELPDPVSEVLASIEAQEWAEQQQRDALIDAERGHEPARARSRLPFDLEGRMEAEIFELSMRSPAPPKGEYWAEANAIRQKFAAIAEHRSRAQVLQNWADTAREMIQHGKWRAHEVLHHVDTLAHELRSPSPKTGPAAENYRPQSTYSASESTSAGR